MSEEEPKKIDKERQSPIGRRKHGRSCRSWRNEVNEAMEKRELEDGE